MHGPSTIKMSDGQTTMAMVAAKFPPTESTNNVPPKLKKI